MARISSLPFWGVQVAAVAGVVWFGWSWAGLVLALGLYYLRMFFVSAGYHRYFSHRAFKTSRTLQFILALGGTLSVQKGVLWWAANHRIHHRYADQPGDVHSPSRDGIWWAHVGWILSSRYVETDWKRIKDFARYPELRWLNRHYLVPPIGLAVLLFAFGGAWALLWGFFVSTTLLWHGTFCINSFAHLIGTRRFATPDTSRNNLALALITMGEGWHNNHHHLPSAANQGIRWWEIDATYYLLLALARLGLVWGVRSWRGPAPEPPSRGATAAASIGTPARTPGEGKPEPEQDSQRT